MTITSSKLSLKKYVLSIPGARFVLLGISGIAYGASFTWCWFLFWLMVPAFVALGWLFVDKRMSFGEAFWWGACAFAPRVFGVFSALVRSLGMSWWLTLGASTLFSAYLVVQVALVITAGAWLAQHGKRFFRLITFFGVLFLMHWWLVSGLFWVFGAFEGDATSHPLVPWFCGCAGRLVGTRGVPQHILRFAVVRLPFKPLATVCEVEHLDFLSRSIAQLAVEKPEVSVILLPESSLPYCLNTHSSSMAALSLLSERKALVFSGHRQEGDSVSSCCYFFNGGQLSSWCEKYHLMFFVERAPALFGLPLPCSIGHLIGIDDFFVPGKRERVPFVVSGLSGEPVSLLYPLICSELFMTNQIASVPSTNCAAVALVNDAWFAGSAQPDLMFGLALLKAWWYQKDLFYVGYRYATYICGRGLRRSAHLAVYSDLR
ncbi:MAG: hypothetical protein JW725_02530 [Candidatus Babeliaceae bacterium]|nr:hypothetical protein [Candidatus Babeliaceae bacterium]